jgi:hypothetical protein
VIPLQEHVCDSIGLPTTLDSHEPMLPQLEQVLVEQCHSKPLSPSLTSTSHGPGAGAKDDLPRFGGRSSYAAMVAAR